MSNDYRTNQAIDRNRILEAAEELITLRGADQMTIQAIMQHLNSDEAMISQHFGSASELLDEVVRHMCTFSVPLFLRTIEGRSPADGLALYFSRYLSADHLQLSRQMCPIANLAGSFKHLSPSARSSYSDAYTGLVDQIATQLSVMGVASAFEEATAFMTQASGAFMIARALPTGTEAEEVLTASRASILGRVTAFTISANATGADR